MEDKKVRSDPKAEGLLTLAIGMHTGSSTEALETLEKMGQREAVTSTQLPAQGTPGAYRHAREEEQVEYDLAWEETGIVFGDLEGGELFRDVKLPSGWKQRPTDHHMWNEVVDDRGRVRASYFYKAASYDRDAFINLKSRFCVAVSFLEDEALLQMEVTDAGTVVFQTRTENLGPRPETREERLVWYDTKDAAKILLQRECETWLDERYPDWRKLWGHWKDE